MASRVRIQLDAKARLIPVADCATQPGDALRHRVAVGIVALRGLHQFVDNVLRRDAVRVAHAHVYDIFATTARIRLQLPGDVEYVRAEGA